MIRVWRGLKDGVGVGFRTRCCVGTGFRDKGGVYGNRPDRINIKKSYAYWVGESTDRYFLGVRCGMLL